MYLENDDVHRESRRELEIELSRIDEAIQMTALMLHGSIWIYDHGKPLRSIEVVETDGITRRILIDPVFRKNVEKPGYEFVVIIDAWRDSDKGRASWHEVQRAFDKLPEQFPEQMKILQDCWNRLKTVKVDQLKM
jgi:hypothetical protein